MRWSDRRTLELTQRQAERTAEAQARRNRCLVEAEAARQDARTIAHERAEGRTKEWEW